MKVFTVAVLSFVLLIVAPVVDCTRNTVCTLFELGEKTSECNLKSYFLLLQEVQQMLPNGCLNLPFGLDNEQGWLQFLHLFGIFDESPNTIKGSLISERLRKHLYSGLEEAESLLAPLDDSAPWMEDTHDSIRSLIKDFKQMVDNSSKLSDEEITSKLELLKLDSLQLMTKLGHVSPEFLLYQLSGADNSQDSKHQDEVVIAMMELIPPLVGEWRQIVGLPPQNDFENENKVNQPPLRWKRNKKSTDRHVETNAIDQKIVLDFYKQSRIISELIADAADAGFEQSCSRLTELLTSSTAADCNLLVAFLTKIRASGEVMNIIRKFDDIERMAVVIDQDDSKQAENRKSYLTVLKRLVELIGDILDPDSGDQSDHHIPDELKEVRGQLQHMKAVIPLPHQDVVWSGEIHNSTVQLISRLDHLIDKMDPLPRHLHHDLNVITYDLAQLLLRFGDITEQVLIRFISRVVYPYSSSNLAYYLAQWDLMESLEFMASVESLLDLYTHNKSDAMQYSNNCIDSVYNWSVYNQSDVEGERLKERVINYTRIFRKVLAMSNQNSTLPEMCAEADDILPAYEQANSSACSRLIEKLREGRRHRYFSNFLLASQALEEIMISTAGHGELGDRHRQSYVELLRQLQALTEIVRNHLPSPAKAGLSKHLLWRFRSTPVILETANQLSLWLDKLAVSPGGVVHPDEWTMDVIDHMTNITSTCKNLLLLVMSADKFYEAYVNLQEVREKVYELRETIGSPGLAQLIYVYQSRNPDMAQHYHESANNNETTSSFTDIIAMALEELSSLDSQYNFVTNFSRSGILQDVLEEEMEMMFSSVNSTMYLQDTNSESATPDSFLGMKSGENSNMTSHQRLIDYLAEWSYMLLISGGEGNTTHLCEKLSHRDIDGDHISVTGCLEVMQAREGLNNQLSNSTLSLLNTIHQLGRGRSFDLSEPRVGAFISDAKLFAAEITQWLSQLSKLLRALRSHWETSSAHDDYPSAGGCPNALTADLRLAPLINISSINASIDSLQYSHMAIHGELRDILKSIQMVRDPPEPLLCQAWSQLSAVYRRVSDMSRHLKPLSVLELVLYLGGHDNSTMCEQRSNLSEVITCQTPVEVWSYDTTSNHCTQQEEPVCLHNSNAFISYDMCVVSCVSWPTLSSDSLSPSSSLMDVIWSGLDQLQLILDLGAMIDDAHDLPPANWSSSDMDELGHRILSYFNNTDTIPSDLPVSVALGFHDAHDLLYYAVSRSFYLAATRTSQGGMAMMFCTMYGSMYQLSLDMSYSDAANVICPDAVDSRFDMIKDNITDDMLTVHEKILRLIRSKIPYNQDSESSALYNAKLLDEMLELRYSLSQTLSVLRQQFVNEMSTQLVSTQDGLQQQNIVAAMLRHDSSDAINIQTYHGQVLVLLGLPSSPPSSSSSYSPSSYSRRKRSTSLTAVGEKVRELISGIKRLANDHMTKLSKMIGRSISPIRDRRQLTKTMSATDDEEREADPLSSLINWERCGSIEKLFTPRLVDMVGVIEPMLVYIKNSFVLRWILGPEPVFLLRDLATDYLGERWMTPGLYSFGHVVAAMGRHCRASAVLHPDSVCMKEALSSMDGCRYQWQSISPFFYKISERYCDMKSNKTKPDVIEKMRKDFPHFTSVMACFITDGEFDFLADDFWESPLAAAFSQMYYRCHLETTLKDLGSQFEQLFKRDINKIPLQKLLNFLSGTASRLAAPLRCMAKSMHPYCARKGVDINAFLIRTLPHMSMMTAGLIDIPISRVTFEQRKDFRSKDRRSVMIFGDPHVQYYLSDDTGPQTCNELDTFTESDGLVANSSVSLMENDFYRISGMFGKFKLNNTGTYLHSVSVEFLKDGVDPIDVGDSKLMYEASAGSINASLSLISPENKVATLIMEERVNKYSTNKMIILERKVRRQKNVTILKDQQSGSLIAISNPYGPVLNVLVRSATDLLDISSGILINGCVDDEDRQEIIEFNRTDDSSTQRRKRDTGVCEQICSSLNDSMAETCLYDCYQATDTEFQQQVSDSMEDATETSEEVVEVDTELSETAVQEDVPDDVVKTTVAMATDSFFVSTVTMAGVSGDNSTAETAETTSDPLWSTSPIQRTRQFTRKVIGQLGVSIPEAISMATDPRFPCKTNYLSHMALGVCWDGIL